MTAQRLTELGFTNIVKATMDLTAQAIYNEIDTKPEIAVRVLDEVQNENDPYPVDKDNYDLFLEDWVETQAESLHLVQY